MDKENKKTPDDSSAPVDSRVVKTVRSLRKNSAKKIPTREVKG